MANAQSDPRPGDVFLDRYMPNASDTERENARANLYALLSALLHLEERRAREEDGAEIRENGDIAIDSREGSHAPNL